MTTRRDFIRQGALWVAGAALVEPVTRKLWAFPVNPCAPSGVVERERSYTFELTLPDGTHRFYTGVRPIYTTDAGWDVIEVPLDGVKYRPQVFAKDGGYHWGATPIAPRA